MLSGPSIRTKKVTSLIREKLSRILLRETNDPRLINVGMITISSIDLAPDHRNATIYVSFMNTNPETIEGRHALKALNAASGFLQYSLKKTIHLKNIPQLIFRYDASFNEAAKINDLLDQALGGNRDEHLRNTPS